MPADSPPALGSWFLPSQSHPSQGLPLSGLDASFLHIETDEAPMHTLKVLVVRLPPDVRDVRGALLRRLEAQLEPLLALRVRPRFGRFGRVAWEPVHVDVSAHVEHRIVCGGERERTRALGALASERLPRDRPLWTMLAFEDRRRGELTLALQIHHALADGKAAARMLEIAAGRAPAPALPVAPRARRPALVALLHALALLPATIARTMQGLVRSHVLARALGAQPARPFGGAVTSFTGPVTATRRVGVASLSLAALTEVKRAAGVTLNDVVLALTAGALRRYLDARGERVERPLIAAMPVASARATTRSAIGARTCWCPSTSTWRRRGSACAWRRGRPRTPRRSTPRAAPTS